jgi:cysteine desulfurase
MQTPIYLDYAATTPVDPRVAAKMWRFLTPHGVFGNPASHSHVFGRTARIAVEQAREQVAALLNADPQEIVWTSGATEANNLALKGIAHRHSKKGRHIITSKIEHRSVLGSCQQLEREGYQVTYVDPEPNGLIALDKLEAALRADTILVSIAHANNEIGVVQDLSSIGELTRRQGILLHSDAAQSAGKVPLDLQSLAVDLLSLSAHKLYGPKGIGALYVRRKTAARLEAQLHGGGQEHGLRAGTLATHQIIGMGEAFWIAKQEAAAEQERLLKLSNRLWDGLRPLEEVYLNGDPERRLAGTLNVSFNLVDNEALILAMKGIAVSSGSACSSASQELSHVLRALGLSEQLTRSAIRFSLGRFTTEREIDSTIAAVSKAVNELRTLSPLWEMFQQGIDLSLKPWVEF